MQKTNIEWLTEAKKNNVVNYKYPYVSGRWFFDGFKKHLIGIYLPFIN